MANSHNKSNNNNNFGISLFNINKVDVGENQRFSLNIEEDNSNNWRNNIHNILNNAKIYKK